MKSKLKLKLKRRDPLSLTERYERRDEDVEDECGERKHEVKKPRAQRNDYIFAMAMRTTYSR